MSRLKKTLKYALVAIIALCVVAASAILPPYLAKKNDQVFLGKISKDTQASESYQYKASKYQKTKVLYEIIEANGDFFGTNLRREQTAEQEKVSGAEEPSMSMSVQVEVLDGKDAKKAAVMTQAQAEMALVREAKLLQSAGAIPHFDLGKQGDYSAVESIAFWRASDPTVSNSEFCFWQGLISNPKTGERYHLVIDDDIGKVYYMSIEYFLDAQDWDTNMVHMEREEKELRKTADAFAAYHELAIDKALQPVYDADLMNHLYVMTNADYEIMTEAQMVPVYQSYKMILKPADLL